MALLGVSMSACAFASQPVELELDDEHVAQKLNNVSFARRFVYDYTIFTHPIVKSIVSTSVSTVTTFEVSLKACLALQCIIKNIGTIYFYL